MCKITESCSPPVSPSCGGNKPIVVLTTATTAGSPTSSSLKSVSSSEQRRRVRFGSDVEHVFEKDFTDADMRHIWYNGEEFDAMKNEIYAMFRSLQRPRIASSASNKRPQHEINNDNDDHDDNNSHWHWRGFEHVQQKRPRKEIRRKFVSDLVYFHKRVNSDPEGLGLYAVTTSRGSMERARQLALLDETEAFEIYKETEVDWAITCSSSPSSDDSTCSETITEESSETEEEAEEESESGPSSFSEQHHLLQPSNPVIKMNMRRLDHDEDGDSKTIRLLHEDFSPPTQDKEAVSLSMMSPYKMARILFPCIC